MHVTLIFVVAIIFAIKPENCVTQDVDVILYLYKYGYLDDNNTQLSMDNSSVTHALALFQEYYQLSGDSILNNVTLDVMRRPRCGNRDIPHYKQNRQTPKWTKTHLTWNFQFADKLTLTMAEQAFSLWVAKTPLTFERKILGPDIMISYEASRHTMSDLFNAQICREVFDGKGGVVAHAIPMGFSTNGPIAAADIYVDNAEQWFIQLKKNPPNTMHLLRVLAHEISHALGLEHSTCKDAVMYAYGSSLEPYPVELSIDDTLAIQNLYGAKNNEVVNEIATTTTTIKPTEQIPEYLNICDAPYIDNMLLLENKMFITYKQYAWSMDIEDKKYSKSIVLADYMTFLPKNVSITAAYQRASGDIVLFVRNKIFLLEYPSFTLKSGWPKNITNIGLSSDAEIITVINTNKGRTYIIFNENNVAEINECTMSVVKYFALQTIFPGISITVQSAFRYVDGHIYFFDKKHFYKFNEFTKTVVMAGRFNLMLFGVECPKNGIIQQLRDFLNRLIEDNSSPKKKPPIMIKNEKCMIKNEK
ncbi:matrix metalloproteinase-2 isoform X1 [Solenopsis invicta]|uniref:matrix metalloproteinase-2 isoform X1 n=1 Tax=Solenopsis invicta TaxID=13686 RepID=UPI00059634C2|nr:matrix metalloproteinase-2 isoform X1 [Solenopsis invicta]